MKFIDIAIPHFGDEPAKEEGVLTPIATTPKAKATFGRRPVEEYTLDDTAETKSIASNAGDTSIASTDQKDQFYDATDDQTEVC